MLSPEDREEIRALLEARDLSVSPWLTTDEACTYLRYAGKCRLRSLYAFLKDKGVPTARRGHTLLIARADLDRAIGATRRKK